MQGGARVWSGGDGAGATWQRMRQRGKGGLVLPAMMAVGALQKGAWVAVGVRMEAGTRAGGTGEWWVNDPDVCGLWFQESLPLCMVITPSVLFSCLL
jgi:hypothetical protein